jgi:hypothetical protein
MRRVVVACVACWIAVDIPILLTLYSPAPNLSAQVNGQTTAGSRTGTNPPTALTTADNRAGTNPPTALSRSSAERQGSSMRTWDRLPIELIGFRKQGGW